MTDAPSGKTILPPEHKKRLWQGVVAWLALVVAVVGWTWAHAEATARDWSARIPKASSPVGIVYLTPQISETAHHDFETPAPAQEDAAQPAQGSVALIMTGLGLSESATNRAIEGLPSEVALAFSPYGEAAKGIKSATAAKHEALLLLPMEPRNYPKDDPGPKALLSRISIEENAHALASLLKEGEGAYGVMNFMGSAFLSDQKNVAALYAALSKAHLVFVEDRQDKSTEAGTLAATSALPYLATDIKIDAQATETDIGAQLVALENLARKQGYAIGVAEPYPASFNIIHSWAEKLGKRGVRLLPLSDILKLKHPSPLQEGHHADPAR